MIRDHAALRDVLGAADADACYRFTVKLRAHGDMLATFPIGNVIAALRTAKPEMGQTVDRQLGWALRNGQRYVSRGGALRGKRML